MYAALSLGIPVIKENLIKFISWGPAVFVKHALDSRLISFIQSNDFIEITTKYLKEKIHEVMIPEYIQTTMINHICPSLFNFCKMTFQSLVELICDAEPKVDNLDRIDVYMGHYPAGTSFKLMSQWKQWLMAVGNVFQKFDYGPEENFLKYGQPKPPAYQ